MKIPENISWRLDKSLIVNMTEKDKDELIIDLIDWLEIEKENVGFQEAFYEIAKVLQIGAQAQSPKVVFESVMLPLISKMTNTMENGVVLPRRMLIREPGVHYYVYPSDAVEEAIESAGLKIKC